MHIKMSVQTEPVSSPTSSENKPINLVYKNEQPLFVVLLVISVLVWLGLLVGTLGIILIYLLAFSLFYLFAQSAFISYLKGTAVEITPAQFPDLYEKIDSCSHKLGLAETPKAYLLHMGGAFNALATRFLGRNFIVLFSDIVDALEGHDDALNFYIGHEIGHIKRGHLVWGPVLLPTAPLPLVSAAYSRAREYTCDRHGFAVCADPNSAALALAALAAGGKRWKTLNNERYVSQTQDTTGFWMSLHELMSDYPWLTKRVAAVQALANGQEVSHPGRHPIAWMFAFFMPRMGMGAGAGAGAVVVMVMFMVAMIGMFAAIAFPQYQDYTTRAKVTEAVMIGRQASQAVERYYQENEEIPESLEEAGFSLPPSTGVHKIIIDPRNNALNIIMGALPVEGKSIILTPEIDAGDHLTWRCSSQEIDKKLLPQDCQN